MLGKKKNIKSENFEMKLIIDATNATFGRLASYAAKQALQGNDIVILNSEKAIISGRKENIIEKYQELRKKEDILKKDRRF